VPNRALAYAMARRYDFGMPLDLVYPAILRTFGRHAVRGATESRALLAWFLDNYYRLNDLEIQDSICDGHGDKGIDGIYISPQLRRIDFFQVTVAKANDKTQGYAKIQQFAGAIGQFSTKANAEAILATANQELRALAERVELLKCIDEGYEQHGVFVTNADADKTATDYLATQPQLALYDGVRLKNEFVTIDKTEPIQTAVFFDITAVPSLVLPIGTNLNMVVAPISAAELLTMDGITNGDLFAWNVRQWLGKNTAVNKAVARSIQTPEEHKYFPAFHNGVTILCRTLNQTNQRIEISGYAVVNGCQSIKSLHENQTSITSDLRILTKFIQVPPDSDLALKITDHTNNQNGTSARDLQSNTSTQTRLQSEIHRVYPEFQYRIKRGEHPEWPSASVIENELLARIILAFDLDKPEAWSQNYKLFRELHDEIFSRPEMNAHRAVFLYDAYTVVYEKLSVLDDAVFANYTLTRWLVLHLVREALLTDAVGKSCFGRPSDFLSQPNGRVRLRECIGHITQTLVRALNGEVKRRSDAGYFDYKKLLKNKEFVSEIRSKLIPFYQMAIDSALAKPFAKNWTDSAPTPITAATV
jgi:hypothetical protein